MESLLNGIDNFQFDFDAMNLDLNAFPDPTQPDCNFEFFFNSVFELDTSFHGDGIISASFTTPESCSSPEADHLLVPDMQPSEPEWTAITPQCPTEPAHPVLPLLWRPCSPPAHLSPPTPLKQFQYPDPQIHSVSQPVPYFCSPPRSVPDHGGVSPLRSIGRPTKSLRKMTSAPIAGLKRRRSIHFEDLYTSDQESASYDSDSSLSSAPPSPSVSCPPCLTRHGAKMGRKHQLEQTKERQLRNERRRAYYHRHKQNPSWKARVNALERTRYYKRRAGTLDLHAYVAPAKTQTADLTSNRSTATSKQPKPKWKGWVVLSDDEAERSEQNDRTSLPNAKKRMLTKEIKNTKEFVQSRGQAEQSDGDDDDDGEEYRIISMDQSHRHAADRDTWVRRSRRARHPISYAEGL